MQTCEVGVASGNYEAPFLRHFRGSIQTYCPKAADCPYKNGRVLEYDGHIHHLCLTHGLIEQNNSNALEEIASIPIIPTQQQDRPAA